LVWAYLGSEKRKIFEGVEELSLSAIQKRFPRSFYLQSSTIVAPRLLGAYLHRVVDGIELTGKIVETEAYASYDEASHAFRGKTPRNAVMFGDGGFSYVYFTYGMHHCFNITTNEAGLAEAVLIRAVEPLSGIEKMRLLRQKAIRDRDLTNGPGKLCQAFALTRKENGIDLIESDQLFITQSAPIRANLIGISNRIGINIAQEYPWRFFIKDNEYVSRAKPSSLEKG
jgi:DNA-3-methyladenine glycosylase